MPCPPMICNTPLKKPFVCPHCNHKFRSNGSRTRHINAKHGGLHIRDSPHSEGANTSSDISSYPGSTTPLSPQALGHIFCSPSCNLDTTFSFGGGTENDFNSSNENINNISPFSLLQDTVLTSTEYHPYLNGKMNNL